MEIISDKGNPLEDWTIVLTAAANKYSFQSGIDGSFISITMSATCLRSQCDGSFAFSIGDQQYLTFITDFDGNYNINSTPLNCTYNSTVPTGQDTKAYFTPDIGFCADEIIDIISFNVSEYGSVSSMCYLELKHD